MEIAVIVCGYGKKPTEAMFNYIVALLDYLATDFISKGERCRVIVSGGNTEYHQKWTTEAELMENIFKWLIKRKGLSKDMISIETEDFAYNTFQNIFLSNRLLGNKANNFKNIIVASNEAHFVKNLFACLKVFGSRTISRKVIFFTFPLTDRFGENIKIYFKTVFEAFGYYFRPFGRYLEYLQWRQRTGRNEHLDYWQFCLRSIRSGELI